MQFRFYLVDRFDVKTKINEPIGWTDVTEQILRGDAHGFRQFQEIDTLEFDGKAVSILKKEYDTHGTDGRILFEVDIHCGFKWQPYFRGRVDFMEWSYACSNCRVRVPFTAMGNDIIVTTRNEQKVNLESLESFDGQALEPYDGLGIQIEVPSKAIVLTSISQNEDAENILIAQVDDNNNYSGMANWLGSIKSNSGTGLAQGFIQPNFGIVGFQEIEVFTPSTYVDYIPSANLTTGSIYQMIKYNGDVDLSDVEFSLKLKGKIVDRSNPSGARSASYQLVFIRKPNTGSNVDFLPPLNIPRTSVSGTYDFYEFDIDIFDTISINKGDELYVVIYLTYNKTSTTSFYELWYEQESAFVKFYTQSKTSSSIVKQFLVNEALSRTVEAYSNDEVRVLSNFIGRIDSKPYAREVDGCGSLESITNGLFLRRVDDVKKDTPPLFNVSFTDLFKGLSSIFNLGWGFENDPYRSDKRVVRIEERDYFYQNHVIMELKNINEVVIEVEPTKIYGVVNIGYQKWEAEEYNGLDEFLTKRTYRTTLKTNTKDTTQSNHLSNLIASGYAIEITRRKGNQDTSDWRYDNEAFIICLKRDEEGNLIVEQGGITNPSNIVDPPSILNYRISPARNLLRFVKEIFSCYKTINEDSKLVFTDGEGNYYAAGQYESDCSLEDVVLSENQDIDVDIFVDQSQALPNAFNETISFDYPLSFDQITAIRNNPYGLIKWSSGKCNGYGWIQQIERNVSTGLSKFTLINSRFKTYRVKDIQLSLRFVHFEVSEIKEEYFDIMGDLIIDNLFFNSYADLTSNDKNLIIDQLQENFYRDTSGGFKPATFIRTNKGFIIDFREIPKYSSSRYVRFIVDILSPYPDAMTIFNSVFKLLNIQLFSDGGYIPLHQKIDYSFFNADNFDDNLEDILFQVKINDEWVDKTSEVNFLLNDFYGTWTAHSEYVIEEYRLVYKYDMRILKTGTVERI